MTGVDVMTKQQVIVEFLTGENVPPNNIHSRLHKLFGEDTVDLETVMSWAKRPGESELRIDARIGQRVMVQFLTAEGEKPSQISWRLAEVYHTVPYSPATIWRWASRFKKGDSEVGDRLRNGRPPEPVTPADSASTLRPSAAAS